MNGQPKIVVSQPTGNVMRVNRLSQAIWHAIVINYQQGR
jgi:hypothetical protein